MNKIYTLLTITAAFITQSVSAQYCTCPPYSSGPFTGFTQVSMGAINSPSGLDPSVDYTSMTANVDPSGSYTMDVNIQHDFINDVFTDMVEVRVWIDWNQDFDFTDPGEEMVNMTEDLSASTGSSNNLPFSYTINVPAGAAAGNTRMRCYTDMLVADGHNTPDPCGYGGGLGQHGEVEDYTVNVSGGGGASIVEAPAISNLSIFPNPTTDAANIIFDLNLADWTTIAIVNLQGQTVLEIQDTYFVGPNQVSIETSDLEKGIYLVTISNTEGIVTEELVIQ
jgi:hypothetical protein